MHQPIGSSPYSPESSSHSSNSPLSHSYSSRNSPVMSASPNSVYLGNSPNHPGAIRNARILPCLSILNQPQGKFRFRYASEMTGTHGCLMAESKERNKKEYIRVQLEGCQEREAIIRCTLVTNSLKPVPHVHRLGGEGNSNGTAEGEYQEMVVSANKNDWIATFSGLTIIHTAKKQVREVVERRLLSETGSAPLNRSKGQQLKDEADKIANSMDLHSVKLKFEAFVDRNGFRERICAPEYSQAIHNLKSTHAGDLRIVRIDKVYSCCTGQEEIFIFVEKVNKKDIKIRFFETDENDQEIWFAFADFSELDVHHQYAIAFKTPAYQDQNIQSDVTVYFQLFRPSNQSTSEAKSFTYTPRERVGIKRPRRDIPLNSDSHINKREYNPTRTSSQEDHSNSITPIFRSNYFSGEKEGAQDISCTLRGHQVRCLEDVVDSTYSAFQTSSIISPLNAILINGPSQEQQWSTLSPAPIQYSHSTGQQIPRPHLPSRTASDDLLKIAVESGIAPFEQDNLTWPEINLEQVDDILLAELLKLDDYSSDASGSATGGLSSQLKHLALSQNTFKQSKPSTKTPKVSYNFPTSAFMSTYSMNMARAVRWYAATGDLAHILVRMQHLLAVQSDDGDNALHDALIHSQTDVVRAILHSVSYHNKELEFINARNNAELAPLHIAVLKNHTEATALLLQNGANPNMADANGNTPLHLASMDKHLIDCLQLILNTSPRRKSTHTLNLNARNYAGQTALHIAVNAKNTKTVELLLEKGVDVNSQEIKCGRSALHTAVKNRSKDIVTLLLRCASVNVNIQSYDGSTALHLAVMDELYDICTLLINYGADPSILNYLDSRTTSDNEDSDESPEDQGAENLSDDISEGSEKGQSPLELAQSNSMIFKLLQGGIIRSDLEFFELTSKEKTADNTSQSKVLDSGIDLMTSKEIQKELDIHIIKKLSSILDSPEKIWERLADSLGLLSSMKSVLDQQESPATYLLSNIDLWDVSIHTVVEKLHALQIKDAAKLLEEFLAT